jgi:hypothetical protein
MASKRFKLGLGGPRFICRRPILAHPRERLCGAVLAPIDRSYFRHLATRGPRAAGLGQASERGRGARPRRSSLLFPSFWSVASTGHASSLSGAFVARRKARILSPLFSLPALVPRTRKWRRRACRRGGPFFVWTFTSCLFFLNHTVKQRLFF